MADYTIKDIRNIAFVSHAGSGKTSLIEALLFNSGASNRFGKVDEGNTACDYNPDEIERRTSINSKIVNLNIQRYKVHIVDTPGYADFIGELISSLYAVDSAIVLLDAIAGIEVGTERVWELLSGHNLAALFFINKLDKENAEFVSCVESLKRQFGQGCVPIQYPVGLASTFKAVVSLLSEKEIESLTRQDKEQAVKFRDNLIETVAEKNDPLLEKYLMGITLSEEEIVNGLREAVSKREIFPIFCGSAINNIGTKELLEWIAGLTPAPDERPPKYYVDVSTKEKRIVELKGAAPFSAQVFKTISDPYVGQLTIFRIFSGTLKSDSGFYNSTRQSKERIGQIFLMHGREQRPVPEAIAGDIIAVSKLKDTSTGDTLCDEKNSILFDPIPFPEPAISSSVRPKARGDEEKISGALQKLASEDMTLRVGRDEQTKELIISGIGDLHIDIVIGRLKKRFGVEVEIGTPKVAYKETVIKISKVQGKYKRQSGGRGQYGDAWLQIEPLPRGSGFEFVDKIVGGVIPKNYIPAVEKGVREAMAEGILAGYPIIDIRVTLYDGSYHVVDSSDIAFKIAGAMAFRKGALEASPVLLEPIMNVDVMVPEEYMGDIAGNLNSRRGRIIGMEVHSKSQVIKAQVPLAEMFKYASELRSMTGGRGSYSMKFSHYEEVPAKTSQTIIGQYQAQKKEQEK